MCELPHELPNGLRLRISRKSQLSRKSQKRLNLMASPQSATLKPNFGSCVRNCKTSGVKHSKEPPILLNCLHLATIFWPWLSHVFSSMSFFQLDRSNLRLLKCLLFSLRTLLLISHVRTMFVFYSPWKHQKIRGFLLLSGGREWKHLREMC